MPIVYAIVSSGFGVTGDVDLRQRIVDSIFVPSVTSGDLAVQGNVDTTSANFLRMMEVRDATSGDLRFATGVGSRMIPWPSTVSQPAYARFEFTGSTQTDNRTLTLVTRPR